ncbi:MAG: haloacid dehalogenase-like hydrolase [Spirochaetia bacterium]|nr:haloacid dehalogenase-like hydrolase [Spirochaetia bacterium]
MEVALEGRWNADARSRLGRILSERPGVAAFDFDNTLIFNDLGEACLYYIALQGLLPLHRSDFWQEMVHPLVPQPTVDKLKETYGHLDPEDNYDVYVRFVDTLIGTYHKIAEQDGLESAYRWTRIFFGGQTVSDMEGVARSVFEYECERAVGESLLPSGIPMAAGIRMYPEMEWLVRELLKRGWDVHIVTASPEVIIRKVAPQWGISPDNVHGMQLVLKPEENLLLPVIQEPMTYGPGKVEALRNKVKEPLRFAAGDSYTDWDLLTYAEDALLIDRGRPDLRQDAQKNGMIIQERFEV